MFANMKPYIKLPRKDGENSLYQKVAQKLERFAINIIKKKTKICFSYFFANNLAM